MNVFSNELNAVNVLFLETYFDSSMQYVHVAYPPIPTPPK